jgi:hypothetical protein
MPPKSPGISAAFYSVENLVHEREDPAPAVFADVPVQPPCRISGARTASTWHSYKFRLACPDTALALASFFYRRGPAKSVTTTPRKFRPLPRERRSAATRQFFCPCRPRWRFLSIGNGHPGKAPCHRKRRAHEADLEQLCSIYASPVQIGAGRRQAGRAAYTVRGQRLENPDRALREGDRDHGEIGDP